MMTWISSLEFQMWISLTTFFNLFLISVVWRSVRPTANIIVFSFLWTTFSILQNFAQNVSAINIRVKQPLKRQSMQDTRTFSAIRWLIKTKRACFKYHLGIINFISSFSFSNKLIFYFPYIRNENGLKLLFLVSQSF